MTSFPVDSSSAPLVGCRNDPSFQEVCRRWEVLRAACRRRHSLRSGWKAAWWERQSAADQRSESGCGSGQADGKHQPSRDPGQISLTRHQSSDQRHAGASQPVSISNRRYRDKGGSDPWELKALHFPNRKQIRNVNIPVFILRTAKREKNQREANFPPELVPSPSEPEPLSRTSAC